MKGGMIFNERTIQRSPNDMNFTNYWSLYRQDRRVGRTWVTLNATSGAYKQVSELVTCLSESYNICQLFYAVYIFHWVCKGCNGTVFKPYIWCTSQMMSGKLYFYQMHIRYLKLILYFL